MKVVDALGHLYQPKNLGDVWHTPALSKNLASKLAFSNSAPLPASLAQTASLQIGAILAEALPPGIELLGKYSLSGSVELVLLQS